MFNKLKHGKKLITYKSLLTFVLLFLIVCLVISPEIYMNSILNGIILWFRAVLPALFPFFFLTTMITELGGVQAIARVFQPITRKIYNVGGLGAYVFVMSIISGYPIGAKITSELHAKGLLTSNECARLTTFTSTSGPLFIIGTVGFAMFGNKSAGLIIFIAHILGSLVNGLFYRKYKVDKSSQIISNEKSLSNIDNLLSHSISNSILSVLMVGGYIALFFMLTDILVNLGFLAFFGNILSAFLGIFGITSAYSFPIASGLVEMTRGCFELSLIFTDIKFAGALATFIISFSGLSTIIQAMTFLSKCKVRFGFFVFQKFTHALTSSLLAYLLFVIFL